MFGLRATRATIARAATALEASTSMTMTSSMTGRSRGDVGGIAVTAAAALRRMDSYEVVGSTSQRRWKSAAAPATATATASPATAVVDRFDSHSLVKELRNCAFTEPQSEGIVKVTLESMTRAGFVARAELERELMTGRAEVQALKVELASSLREANAHVKHNADTLLGENEKLRADLKYNIDRITQSQKLDLNLEKGRMRELLSIADNQHKEMEARVDKELNVMRTQIEAAKTEIIRYSVGTLVSLGALSLAALRLIM